MKEKRCGPFLVLGITTVFACATGFLARRRDDWAGQLIKRQTTVDPNRGSGRIGPDLDVIRTLERRGLWRST